MTKKKTATTKKDGLDVAMKGDVRHGVVHYHLTMKKDYGQVGVTPGLELSIPLGMTPSEALEEAREILLAELTRSGGSTMAKIENFLSAAKRRR